MPAHADLVRKVRFISGLRTNRRDASDFANGLKVQAYLHVSLLSGRLGKPVKVGI